VLPVSLKGVAGAPPLITGKADILEQAAVLCLFPIQVKFWADESARRMATVQAMRVKRR
jgi:hypothetical protein